MGVITLTKKKTGKRNSKKKSTKEKKQSLFITEDVTREQGTIKKKRASASKLRSVYIICDSLFFFCSCCGCRCLLLFHYHYYYYFPMPVKKKKLVWLNIDCFFSLSLFLYSFGRICIVRNNNKRGYSRSFCLTDRKENYF